VGVVFVGGSTSVARADIGVASNSSPTGAVLRAMEPRLFRYATGPSRRRRYDPGVARVAAESHDFEVRVVITMIAARARGEDCFAFDSTEISAGNAHCVMLD